MGKSKENLIFQKVFSCSPHFLGVIYTFSLRFQGYFLHTKVSWGWVVKFHFPGGKSEPSLIHGGVTNIDDMMILNVEEEQRIKEVIVTQTEFKYLNG